MKQIIQANNLKQRPPQWTQGTSIILSFTDWSKTKQIAVSGNQKSSHLQIPSFTGYNSLLTAYRCVFDGWSKSIFLLLGRKPSGSWSVFYKDTTCSVPWGSLLPVHLEISYPFDSNSGIRFRQLQTFSHYTRLVHE